VDEEASLGIAQASIVHDEEHLRERIAFVHRRVATMRSPSSTSRARTDDRVLGNDRLATFRLGDVLRESARRLRADRHRA